MKYKFCSIRIDVTKYDVTFATEGVVLIPSSPHGYATATKCEKRHGLQLCLFLKLCETLNGMLLPLSS